MIPAVPTEKTTKLVRQTLKHYFSRSSFRKKERTV